MQRLYTILIIFILFIGTTFARTPQEAAQIASEFIHQRNHATSSVQRIQSATKASRTSVPVELAYTHTQANGITPAIYVFNGKEEDGFVLVSAEDNARAVLGYADQGSFDPQNIPSNMQVWLQMYAEELAYAAMMPQSSANRDKELGSQYPTIEPLLGNTQWGQGKPYNNHCPIIEGERSVAGCVATAISQIMYIHKYPEQGKGNHSYRLRNGTEVSADFSQATYDWENMLPQYKGTTYTTEQADAVAELMFHVGVAANMQYSPSASGSSSGIALQGLNRYFGYDAGVIPLPKDYMPENKILEGIATDLEAGRPVYISAYTTNYEGHAFVCDGMQSNGYLHINWGWTGSGDGYFSISALDPGQHGTGGSAQNLAFTVDVCAYTNIRPDEGGKAYSMLTADALTLKSKSASKRSTDISYELFILSNSGVGYAQGTLVYNLYDQNDQLVHTVSMSKINLGGGYYYQTYPLNGQIDDSVPVGDYNLVVGWNDADNNFQPILIQGKGEVKNAITITEDSIYFYIPQAPKLPDTLAADFTQISGTNTWEMDLYTPNFWDSIATDELLIRCRLNSNSISSVIGTYLLDKRNTSTTNSIHLREVICAIGNGQECNQYTPTALQLTIVKETEDTLGVYYSFEVNFKRYTGYASIPNPTWNQLVGEQVMAYTDSITYEAATALPASKALEIAKTYTESYSMEYLVQGMVSNMFSQPTIILLNQEAQFAISDNGDREGSILCDHIQWLNKAPYSTGEEIQSSDKVVLLGTLITLDGAPQVNGYIYNIERPEWTAPITEFTLATDGMQMIASWASEAKYYKLRLYDPNNKKMAENTLSKTSLTVTLPEKGTYTFWIRPMDNKKKEYVGPVIETTFEIDGISSDVENTTTTSTIVLYDLLGNIVDIRTDGDIQQLNIPQSGIYILKTKEAKVMFLHK